MPLEKDITDIITVIVRLPNGWLLKWSKTGTTSLLYDCDQLSCSDLQVVEEVASAQQTLALLLPQGDFSAALDVLDSLSAIVAQRQLTGLKAFQGLDDSLLATSQVLS